MSEEFLVSVPRDVEADLIVALAAFGVEASTFVPVDRGAGMIRVSRTGGDLVMERQRDRPEVLVEVWEENSIAAFDRAQQVWAAFRVMGELGSLNGAVAAHDMDLQPPRALDDELAPNLYRVQFLVTLTVPLTEIEVRRTNEE